MQYVAVSDIHGELGKFHLLMSNLKELVSFDSTIFVFLGDYVDGGLDTCEVVQNLMLYQKKYPHWEFLKGNHEQMLLDALVNYPNNINTFMHWYTQGGAATAESYKKSSGLSAKEKALAEPGDVIYETHIKWFQNLKYYVDTPKLFFVHAGVTPGLEPHKTPELDMLWLRDEFILSEYDWGKRIIFGHTIQRNRQPWVMKNKIGIDTMYHGNGEITAVILDDENPEWYKFVHSNGEIKHE